MAVQMETLLNVDRKPETEEFVKLLDEMNLDKEEQKVLLGFIQGVKLAKDMEKAAVQEGCVKDGRKNFQYRAGSA